MVWLKTAGNGEWYTLQTASLSPATAGKDYLSSAGAGGVDSAAEVTTAAVGVAQPAQPVEATVPQLLQPVEQPLLQPVEQPVLQPVEQILNGVWVLLRQAEIGFDGETFRARIHAWILPDETATNPRGDWVCDVSFG